MSTARDHAEWLSLVEVSGPFLSLPVLLRVFPQGLDAHDAPLAGMARSAYEEWIDNQGGNRPDPAIHHAWVRFVLTEVLGYVHEVLVSGVAIPATLSAAVLEHGETLRPDIAVMRHGQSDPATLLVTVVPKRQGLEKVRDGHHWKASPATRMAELLRGTGVALGLVTNGEQWMLVYAPRGETAGFASWYAETWFEEKVTLRAFQSLLSMSRFYGVADSDTLEAMLKESSANQQEVTDQLGYQVRQAVEVLVSTIARIDRERHGALLTDIPETALYEAALTVMMRLVFLFSAEERGLLRLGDPLYDQHYAVSTLRAQLRVTADETSEEVLERRNDAWSRLLASFRAVYAGVRHEDLRLPAYGGDLFDPDRFPFLEGRRPGTTWHDRSAHTQPLPIDNRTVLHLLEALQVLRIKVPGGGPAEPRRLSFRALDIEQIGHVYEGLLDHTARRATEPIVGLAGSKDKEPEVPLASLEALRAKGGAALVESLMDMTGRSKSAIQKALGAQPDLLRADALLSACDNDTALLNRVLPFAALVRDDSFDAPVVIPTGSAYVTAGTDRRSSGTHYTPRSLTEPIVQHTLDPLVYIGPAEGTPKEEWKLRPAAELLKLTICDMAMGSGAFLVQACRYMSERLVEAWEEAEAGAGGKVVITPEGDLSSGSPDEQPLPRDAEERLALARRIIADRCLFGVDKNPLAVEMGKLSLWLITLQKDRPFTFLDHRLRCGDSLLGVDERQLRAWSLERHETLQLSWFHEQVDIAVTRGVALRAKIAATPVLDVRDAEAKAGLLRESEEDMSLVHLGADLLVASALEPNPKKRDGLRKDFLSDFSLSVQAYEDRRAHHRTSVGNAVIEDAFAELRARATALLGPHRPFHWPLEFPEVFIAPTAQGEAVGFAAIVGNPPFMGGKKITGTMGIAYRDYLVNQVARGTVGVADLCTYFFLQAHNITMLDGSMSFLATNTIAQGDTREVGLDQMAKNGSSIIRAVPSMKWPGEAGLEVAQIWLRRGKWSGNYSLNEKDVSNISTMLTIGGSVRGEAHRLITQRVKSYQGSVVLSMGFMLLPEEAQDLIALNAHNRDVLYPFFNGDDLNTRPDQSPSRWVINFHDWSLERAENYPDCMRIVRNKVKPERDLSKRKMYRDRWWQFAERQQALYTAIASMEQILAGAITTKYWTVSTCFNSAIYSNALVVFAIDAEYNGPLLGSSIHEVWTREYSGSLESRLRYTPSDCFDTFPFPLEQRSTVEPGAWYYDHRKALMIDRQEGLTKTYNRFHDSTETSSDTAELRKLHVEMDHAVAAAYGWSDVDLDHGFHETKQGIRYTISEAARREVLDRLLALNHERYAEEVKQGLHDKKGGKGKAAGGKRKGGATGQVALEDMDGSRRDE